MAVMPIKGSTAPTLVFRHHKEVKKTQKNPETELKVCFFPPAVCESLFIILYSSSFTG